MEGTGLHIYIHMKIWMIERKYRQWCGHSIYTNTPEVMDAYIWEIQNQPIFIEPKTSSYP